MTLPASGPISLGDVNVELGLSATAQISMNDAAVRSLFGKASGAISMSDGYGKSNRVALSYTFGSNTANASLNVTSIGGYVAGKSDITITVNSGVYLYATTTGSYALSLSGATTGDTVTLVNNGFIMGQGGDGVLNPASSAAGYNGNAGGPALNLGVGISAVTINTQSGYIGGGGGSGGSNPSGAGSGGGAGGGVGGGSGSATGGAGGGIGASGGNGVAPQPLVSGGGGGRIMPGTGGAGARGDGANLTFYPGKGGGAGGSGGSALSMTNEYSGAGGSGSGVGGGSYCDPGANCSVSAGGGGGWGAAGGNASAASYGTTTGGAGGKAVNLNGKSITWTGGFNSGRVFGAVA